MAIVGHLSKDSFISTSNAVDFTRYCTVGRYGLLAVDLDLDCKYDIKKSEDLVPLYTSHKHLEVHNCTQKYSRAGVSLII